MQTYKNIDVIIEKTSHAEQRIAQRGVCQKALSLLSLHGIDSPAGSGCSRRELRYSQVAELHQQGVALKIIDKAIRLEAIFSKEDQLITCYQRAPRETSRGSRRNRINLRVTGWGRRL